MRRGCSSAGWRATLIPDNTKAMIIEPDALAPTLVAAFLDYVQARGAVRRSRARAVAEGQAARREPGPVRARELVRRRDVHDLERRARERRALVSRDRRHARARHDAQGAARSLRVAREGRRCFRRPTTLFDVPLWTRQGEGASRPSHRRSRGRSTRVPTLYLGKHGRVRADRTLGEDLLRHRADQDARARQPPGRTLRPTRATIPLGKDIYAMRDVDALLDEREEARRARRHLRRAAARRAAALDHDAAGVCARCALRQVRRRARRGDLPERARASTSSTCSASRACSSRRQTPSRPATASARSCSFRCRASRAAPKHFATRSRAPRRRR